MNVRLGWSGEIDGSWTKMDVEVDEVDLAQHFAEHTETDITRISGVDKFRIMYAIAEILVLVHKMSRFPNVFATEAAKAELSKLTAMRDNLTLQTVEKNRG